MKIRDRLENMLIDQGLVVDVLWGATGQWRKTIMDVMRWEANCRRADGRFVHIGSWETMTDCVRYGFKLVQEEETYEMEATIDRTKSISSTGVL